MVNDIEMPLRGKRLLDNVSQESCTPVKSSEAPIASHARKGDFVYAFLVMLISPSRKSSLMTLGDQNLVSIRLMEVYQPLSNAGINAKISRLQQINMGPNESVIIYSRRIDGLVIELKSAGHHVLGLEMKKALLRKLIDSFTVID